jgi:hypothetical protein
MHFLHAVGRIAHQAWQQLCFRQVAPVLAGISCIIIRVLSRAGLKMLA